MSIERKASTLGACDCEELGEHVGGPVVGAVDQDVGDDREVQRNPAALIHQVAVVQIPCPHDHCWHSWKNVAPSASGIRAAYTA